MRRLLPHPLLSLVLLLLWLLLNNSASAGHFLLGAALALLIPLYTRRFWPEPAVLRRPGLALRLTALVLWDILVANVKVSRLVLGPRAAIRPRFVQVPLDVEGEVAQTVLAGVITLTPGTLSATLDRERRRMLVHALSEDDPEELIRQVKSRYEAPIKEIFAC
jgi:multicomponent K+:H+ antiporter subunit E